LDETKKHCLLLMCLAVEVERVRRFDLSMRNSLMFTIFLWNRSLQRTLKQRESSVHRWWHIV